MFNFTLRQNSSLHIPFYPIYLAGGWGWRLVYTGRAHPLETFLKFLFFLLESLGACSLEPSGRAHPKKKLARGALLRPGPFLTEKEF